jgi:Fuc2NAc and GlcNAc transferase
MIYVVSSLLGGTGAWWISRYAYVLGLMDKPSKRSSHDRPTPKGGGFGLLLAFILVSFYQEIDITFWIPAAVLSMLSLFGDRVDLNPKLRLMVQFCAAGIVLAGLESLPLEGLYRGMVSDVPKYLILIPIFIFFTVFIVGTANFYNFMDGINGIAGVTGIIAFALLGSYGVSTAQPSSLVKLCFAMACACGGFLPFNVPRAKVFMGDVGSILLGFVYACLVVCFAKTFGDFVILIGFLFPFYADELVTMYVRIRDGQDLTLPHRRHLYQILANELAIPHWKVSVAFGVLQLIVGISVMTVKPYGVLPVIVLLLFYFFAFIGYSALVRKKAALKFKSAGFTPRRPG